MVPSAHTRLSASLLQRAVFVALGISAWVFVSQPAQAIFGAVPNPTPFEPPEEWVNCCIPDDGHGGHCEYLMSDWCYSGMVYSDDTVGERACARNCSFTEICDDDKDNDHDYLIDGEDDDCWEYCCHQEPYGSYAYCMHDNPDFCDGPTYPFESDCEQQCQPVEPEPEDCNDGIDNDYDGFTDGDDDDCWEYCCVEDFSMPPYCMHDNPDYCTGATYDSQSECYELCENAPIPPEDCSDGIDNDYDGFTDGDDDDCWEYCCYQDAFTAYCTHDNPDYCMGSTYGSLGACEDVCVVDPQGDDDDSWWPPWADDDDDNNDADDDDDDSWPNDDDDNDDSWPPWTDDDDDNDDDNNDSDDDDDSDLDFQCIPRHEVKSCTSDEDCIYDEVCIAQFTYSTERVEGAPHNFKKIYESVGFCNLPGSCYGAESLDFCTEHGGYCDDGDDLNRIGEQHYGVFGEVPLSWCICSIDEEDYRRHGYDDESDDDDDDNDDDNDDDDNDTDDDDECLFCKNSCDYEFCCGYDEGACSGDGDDDPPDDCFFCGDDPCWHEDCCGYDDVVCDGGPSLGSACSDGLDNDGDGHKDEDAAGCRDGLCILCMLTEKWNDVRNPGDPKLDDGACTGTCLDHADIESYIEQKAYSTGIKEYIKRIPAGEIAEYADGGDPANPLYPYDPAGEDEEAPCAEVALSLTQRVIGFLLASNPVPCNLHGIGDPDDAQCLPFFHECGPGPEFGACPEGSLCDYASCSCAFVKIGPDPDPSDGCVPGKHQCGLGFEDCPGSMTCDIATCSCGLTKVLPPPERDPDPTDDCKPGRDECGLGFEDCPGDKICDVLECECVAIGLPPPVLPPPVGPDPVGNCEIIDECWHDGQCLGAGETCDPNSCTCQPLCGNNQLDPGEACDGIFHGCADPLNLECQDCQCVPIGDDDDDDDGPECGNMLFEPPAEGCDGPVWNQCNQLGMICNRDNCQCEAPPPQCGDGLLGAGEECDGILNPCDAGTCNQNTCQCEVCGDGVQEGGEQCEGPNFDQCAAGQNCNRNTCQCENLPFYCVNRLVDVPQQCSWPQPQDLSCTYRSYWTSWYGIVQTGKPFCTRHPLCSSTQLVQAGDGSQKVNCNANGPGQVIQPSQFMEPFMHPQYNKAHPGFFLQYGRKFPGTQRGYPTLAECQRECVNAAQAYMTDFWVIWRDELQTRVQNGVIPAPQYNSWLNWLTQYSWMILGQIANM